MLCHARVADREGRGRPYRPLKLKGAPACPILSFIGRSCRTTRAKGEELQRFYSELFGWKIDADNPYSYGQVNTETARGINGAVGPSEGVSRVSIYVEVDDLQATLDKAVSLGATVAMPVTEIPGAVTMAMFTDPDGHFTGIIKGRSA